MTDLLIPAMKKNHLGRSAKECVYGCGIDHEDAICIGGGERPMTFFSENFSIFLLIAKQSVGLTSLSRFPA